MPATGTSCWRHASCRSQQLWRHASCRSQLLETCQLQEPAAGEMPASGASCWRHANCRSQLLAAYLQQQLETRFLTVVTDAAVLIIKQIQHSWLPAHCLSLPAAAATHPIESRLSAMRCVILRSSTNSPDYKLSSYTYETRGFFQLLNALEWDYALPQSSSNNLRHAVRHVGPIAGEVHGVTSASNQPFQGRFDTIS